MAGQPEIPWNDSHPGSNPSLAFALCLLTGPFGLLYLGLAETVMAGTVFIIGLACSYWIWSTMLPEFIGFSLVLLAFTAKRWTVPPEGRHKHSQAKWPAGSFHRAKCLSTMLSFDMGILCLGESILGQIWKGMGTANILGILLTICITLPVGSAFIWLFRKRILGRMLR